jgi:hypothetical protein
MDADLGPIYLRVQTWAPFRLQFYCNGHNWLARQLAAGQLIPVLDRPDRTRTWRQQPGNRANRHPVHLESNLRTACALAFPSATQADIDAMIEDAMAESRAQTMHAAAPAPSAGHLVPPPSGWPQTPSHFPGSHNTA